jgi:hypothetical protein
VALLWEYRRSGPPHEAPVNRLRQKLRKFDKNIIALTEFDDYDKSFTSKD